MPSRIGPRPPSTTKIKKPKTPAKPKKPEQPKPKKNEGWSPKKPSNRPLE